MGESITDKDRILQLHQALKSERSTWDPHYRELAEFVAPFRARWNTTDRNRGTKKHDKIIDGTASLAHRVFSSGMSTGITSPSRAWFKLQVPDKDLMEWWPVKDWISKVETSMRSVFMRSNLYNCLPVLYGDLGLFGTGCVTIEEDLRRVVRFQTLPVGSYCVANNEEQLVDTLTRELEFTAYQLVRQFGIDNVSQRIKEAYQAGRLNETAKVVHAVLPNHEHNPRRLEAKFKRYRSTWIEHGSEKDFLKDSGFDEFPALVPRWQTTGEDSYGSECPGMLALADVKGLQSYEKKTAKAVDKQLDPPLKGPSSLRNSVVSLLPGGITWVDERGGTDGLRPIHEVNFRLEGAEMKSQQIRTRIDRFFLVDLFLMLASSDRRQITAREVEERHEEKLQMIGPALSRLNLELLDPLIDKTYMIMEKRGMIPPAPPELNGVKLRVEYVSIMAQAQKMIGIAAQDRLSAYIGNLAAVNPAVLDKYDMDQSVDEYAEMLGTSPRLIRPDDVVQQMRAERAAEQQNAQQAALLQQNAQSAKILSETDTRNPSALSALLNSARGLPV